MFQDNQNSSKVRQLKTMRESVDWNRKEDRVTFFQNFYPLIYDWIDGLPNLRDIFQQDEIELLLMDSISNWDQFPYTYGFVKRLVQFVISTGYKDEPKLDEEGKPAMVRHTPVHIAVRKQEALFIPDLFKIYDRFDVNYVGAHGYTHFHAACFAGCYDVVEKFLDFGQDPDFRVSSSNCSPLYLATFCIRESGKKVIELLLRRGADPTLANAQGATPLHNIGSNVDCAKMMLERTARLVHARDIYGKTPLHLATIEGCADLIELLLRKGADPYAVDQYGVTPLQLIGHRVELLELFRKISEENQQAMEDRRRYFARGEKRKNIED
ncbi:ankyrin-1-like [Trichogramma pretiosum]|uniref:ankyrin-1-like n=1 Tax=Trichogramma pretiosum TaxID=7493 RepID=UPI000C71C95B|nr:ankyrin-1-like [Trichogramma pretiosum]